MSRFPLYTGGITVALLAAALAAAQPTTLPPEDETSPALLELIRARLAEVPGLSPADGVQVQETIFFRGTIRVRGTVASADQREAVRREINALRSRLETSVDVRITAIDITGLQVAPAPTPTPAPESSRPSTTPGESSQQPRSLTPQAQEEPVPPWVLADLMRSGFPGMVPPGVDPAGTTLTVYPDLPPFLPPPCYNPGKGRHNRRHSQR